MSWPTAKLSEVAPHTPLKKIIASSEDVVLQLTLDHIESDSGVLLTRNYQPVSDAGSSTHWFDERYVLYSKLRPYLNKVYMPEEKGLGTTELVPMLPDAGRLDRKYLAYYLRSRSFVDWVSAQTAGAKMPRVSMKVFWNHEIPLPPLETQKQIAAILGKADQLRKDCQQMEQELNNLAQSVFMDMFGNPVSNPKGWETRTIEELVTNDKYSIKRGPFGGALKKNIFVSSGNLVYEQFHALNNDFTFRRYFISDKKFEELRAFEVKPKDIIISCSGVNLGKLAEIPEGAPRGIINQALLKLTLNPNIICNQLFIAIFSHPSFKAEFYGDFRGAAIPNFPPMSTFRSFRFICPPVEAQKKYLDFLNSFKLQVERNKELSVEHEANFHSLVFKAFNGELKIKNKAA